MSRTRHFDAQVPAGADRMRVHHLMRELRKRRLTYNAIAGALEVFEGLHLTEHQVRDRLVRLGEPTNPRMSRPPRRST